MDFLGGRMWDRGKEGQLEVLKKKLDSNCEQWDYIAVAVIPGQPNIVTRVSTGP